MAFTTPATHSTVGNEQWKQNEKCFWGVLVCSYTQGDHPTIVRSLLVRRADANLLTVDGQTPLQVASLRCAIALGEDQAVTAAGALTAIHIAGQDDTEDEGATAPPLVQEPKSPDAPPEV